MDSNALKVTYDFSLNPNKSSLNFLHDFLENYPYSKLVHNKIIFFNALFTEIRKASELSQDCISELLFLLTLLKNFEDSKILCIVLEEICNYLQNYVSSKSKTKIPDDFSCIDMQLSLIILKIFKIIFSTKNEKLEKSIYSPGCLLLLSYIVSFLIYCCEYMKERDLQNEALSSLIDIVNNDDSMTINKAEIVVNFAPGIFQSLTKIIKTDRKIGFMIKSKAIECLGKLIVLIYGDQSSTVPTSDRHNWDNYPELKNVVVKRDEKWKQSTWENVGKILKISKYNILERSDEEHWRVKFQLVKLCISVLKNCSCVSESAVDLIECIIVLCSDFDVTVHDEAHRCINIVSKLKFNIPIYWDVEKNDMSQVVHSGSFLLTMAVRRNLDKVISALKELPTIPSDDIKCNTLQVLDGYLSINVMENLAPLNCIQLNLIIGHLITIMRLDHNSLDLLEPIHIINDNSHNFDAYLQNNCNLFTKQFVYFKNAKVQNIIQSILSKLIVVVTPNSVLSMIQSFTEERPEDITSMAFLVEMFIISVSKNDMIDVETKINLFKSILLTYFDGETMNLATNNESNNDNVTNDFWKDSIAAISCSVTAPNALVPCSTIHTPIMLKHNTLYLALIMELCASCSVSFRRLKVNEETESWLMRQCLFEVMNKSQQNPPLLSHVASQCLRLISTTHEKYENSIPILLRINADYILDSISRRLRSAAIMLRSHSFDTIISTRADASCRCLITLCNYAEEEIMPFLLTIINQLLYCIDETHGAGNRLFMSVLTEVVRAICRWRNVTKTHILAIEDTSLLNINSLSNISIVEDFLIERNEILISSGFRKDIREEPIENLEEVTEDESNFQAQKDEQEQQSKQLPPMTVALQNIVNRCINLMSNSNGQIRLSCLEILRNAVLALQKDEDTIKPIVHQIWKPLEHRLWDKEYPVILKAFELVNILSQICAEFLYVKVKNHFVSKLCILLERCAVISLSPTATMKYTGLYRLQANLLLFLSQLSIRTSICEVDLEQVVDAHLIYLDDRQPADLISTCLTSLKHLFLNDPGLVWFKISQIQSCNLGDVETNVNQIYGHIARNYDSHYLLHAEKLLKELDNLIE